jgi:hypothetical protein
MQTLLRNAVSKFANRIVNFKAGNCRQYRDSTSATSVPVIGGMAAAVKIAEAFVGLGMRS